MNSLTKLAALLVESARLCFNLSKCNLKQRLSTAWLVEAHTKMRLTKALPREALDASDGIGTTVLREAFVPPTFPES